MEKKENRKPDRVRIVTIGDTQFEVTSFFSGKETLEDILKRRILWEYQQITHTYC